MLSTHKNKEIKLLQQNNLITLQEFSAHFSLKRFMKIHLNTQNYRSVIEFMASEHLTFFFIIPAWS